MESDDENFAMGSDDRESIGGPLPRKVSAFQFIKHGHHWLGGEPRVFVVDTESEFPKGREFEDAQLITVTYAGGGIWPLFNQIAAAANLPSISHIQILFEYLGDLSDQISLIACMCGRPIGFLPT